MPTIAISLSIPRLGDAAALDIPIELKLNWEDYPILSRERALDAVLDEHDISPDQLHAVHLPPGTETRGREIGMAATRNNVGTVQQFTATQLANVPDIPLVMHPVKRFDRDQYLPVLQQYRHVTGHPIYLENMSARSADLHTVDDLRAFSAAIADRDMDCLQFVVDTAHLPGAADHGWQPTVDVLDQIGEHVAELHLNDPVADGLPALERPHDGVEAVVQAADEHDVVLVIEDSSAPLTALRETTGTLRELTPAAVF